MIAGMHGHHDHSRSRQGVISISCDECTMQCTSACADCVVTFLVSDEHEQARAPDDAESIVLDRDQARVVQLFGAAGMVPRLRYHVAS
jgi:hypothetical protein